MARASHARPTPWRRLSSFNADTDRRHLRRELTPDEIRYLLAVVEHRTLAEHRISGPDRAILYRLGAGNRIAGQ